MTMRREALWTAADTFVTIGVSFGFRMLVARMLAPEGYGIAALAITIIGLMQVVNDFGLTSTLIQRDAREVTPSLVNTTFTASLIVCLILAIVTATVVAPLAADFYRESELRPLLAALAVTLLPSPFLTVASAMLFRKRRFRDVAVVRVAGTTAGVASAGMVLVTDPSPWAVVVQAIVASAVMAVGFAIAARPNYRLQLERTHLRAIFGFSGFVLLGDLVGSFQGSAGIFVLGRTLTTAEVGFYSFAILLTDTARRALMTILNRVTFVHYSQNQHDHDRIRGVFVSTVRWNCRMLFPLMTSIILFGPPIAVRFLGSEWDALGPVLRWLALAVLIGSAGGTTSTLYKGLGRPGLDLSLQLTTGVALLLPALIAGAMLGGLEGAAIATAAVKLVSVILRQTILDRMIGSTMLPILRNSWILLLKQWPLVLAWAAGWLLLPEHGFEIDGLLAAAGLMLYALIELPAAFPAQVGKLWHQLIAWRART